MKAINKQLRALREEHDQKQSQIARLLDTTQQQYSKYETGESDIPIRVIAALSQHYGISADYLICRTECREGVDALNRVVVDEKTIGQVITDILSLDPPARRSVIEYIDMHKLKKRVYSFKR